MRNLIRTTLLLLALLLSASLAAFDFKVDGIYYDINGNEATVTDDGSLYYNHNWYRGEVSIPETVTYNGVTYAVTAIGFQAFYYCDLLTSVTIPNSVTAIDEGAFVGCSGLTSVNIPSTVTVINNRVFEGCSGLASITIPNSVTAIGVGAFSGCSGLTSVTIPGSVTTIGGGAFFYCSGLSSVTIPSSVTSLVTGTFAGCSNLTSLVVESGNTTYDSRDHCNAIIETASNTLLAGCQNTVIPNSVTAIGGGAFSGCSGLTSVNIPGSVTTIGNDAFFECSGLTSVTLPNSITAIGMGAFNRCSALTSVIIPNAVTTINDYTFAECSVLTNVTLPSSLTTIGNYAFYECHSLTSMTIPVTITAIGLGAFGDCSSMTSVTIPGSVMVLGRWAFANCGSMTDVYSHITDLTEVTSGDDLFNMLTEDGNYDYSGRTLHVPQGTTGAYQADGNWRPYFGQIVDDLMPEDDLQGDVNHDGEVNIADVNALIDIILSGGGDTSNADVNGDREINIADVNALIDIILGGSPSQDGHGYVDLGLPSGTLWATCNVGANNPEDYGYYFAWGETELKGDFTWETYKWCNGTSRSMTKYCTKNSYGTIDNRTELEPEDDAASVKWGPSWRMPTEEQINELMSNCSHELATVNGVNGMLLTGPNGNSIFLPAAGCIEGSTRQEAGLYGHYWSRTLDTDSNHFAYTLYTITYAPGVYCGLRNYGFCVRPVRASRN